MTKQTMLKGITFSMFLDSPSLKWSDIDQIKSDVIILNGKREFPIDELFDIKISNRRMFLTFKRSMNSKETYKIKNLSIKQINIFDTAHINISFDPNYNDIDLMHNKFAIKSTNLVARMILNTTTNQETYSLRDREISIKDTDFKGSGNSINDRLPQIEFSEIGINPHLKKGDKIKLI